MEISNVNNSSVVLPTQRIPSTKETTDSLPPYTELKHKEKYQLSLSDESFVNVIEKANRAIEGSQKKFEYKRNEHTGDIIVKVLDADTNEVIREIPPEKIVEMIDKLQELLGIIVDEKR